MLLCRYCSTMKQKVIPNLTILFWVCIYGSVYCQRPAVVNLGAIFSFDSVIGRVAKTAIEAAVADVNSDPRVLSGTKLNLIVEDANCSAFWGSIGAFRVIEKEVVAIIGPQSSGIAHMISEIANAFQVPLLSFAATDPTLSATQFPFFLRTTQGDARQMAAMADLIEYYGWKEVIAIFVDDYYGRSGISALENQLEKKMSKISYKFPLPVWFDDSQIVDFLNQSKSLSTRVYVVHVNPDPGLKIFTTAKKLQMMTGDYVWLTSDWLSTTLDSFYPKKPNSLNLLQGVVGLRPHIPKSRQTSAFVYRWKEMLHKSLIPTELNVYGLYAYDTVWTIAYSIEKFIKEFGNVTFSLNDTSVDTRVTDMLLGKLKVFDGGSLLLKKIMEINFTGLTGQVHFDQDRNVVGCGYDVINIDQMVIRTIGYWTSLSGFSNVPQEIYKEDRSINFRMDQKLNYVTWPGGKTETPRGWVIADDERPLIIGVPKRASFAQFAMEMPDSHQIQGYCIDIFSESLKLVPYYVPYRFKSFGDGHSNPNYEKLVQMVANHEFDLAIGDITITTNRTKFVDFSQPFAATGLVVVAPIDKSEPNAWVFLQPFTKEMWCTIGAAFVIIGVVIWILEHRVNTDFRGPPSRQFATIFLFSFSTLYKKNKETPLTPLGRMVMVVWLFVLMVITSSYTANLTSILTVQQLSSPITGIDSLIASNLPIGYQVGGSFAYSYLTENLFIKKSRLVPLASPEEYEIALHRGPSDGGVAAIVDELPYVRLFLSNQSDFGIIGQSFTKSGWGFAFQRDSTLAVDISTAILKLSENGKLESLQEKWFCKMGCPEERRQDAKPEKLQLISFWGLYILCGSFAISTLLLFLLRAISQFVRYRRKQKDPSPSSSSPSSRTRHSRTIHNFMDFIDKKEETIKKMSTQHENRQPRPQTTTRR